MRAPDAPIGWPMAIAPPLTFTLFGRQPQFLTDRHRLRSECLVRLDQIKIVQPAFSSAFLVAVTGPMPMIEGSTPVDAQLFTLASTLEPRFAASSADISTSAAARR